MAPVHHMHKHLVFWIAAEERETPGHAPPAQRRTFRQLLMRLHRPIASATIDDVIDEVNTPQN